MELEYCQFKHPWTDNYFESFLCLVSYSREVACLCLKYNIHHL